MIFPAPKSKVDFIFTHFLDLYSDDFHARRNLREVEVELKANNMLQNALPFQLKNKTKLKTV
jgi:hypothetical protein